ncbi:MAG: efflux RND transporter periplasmic adaptor subunit [Candidatus Omnitrophica bacterium]|nr:efflux RND transporter periplasmic adaptor subunit [Candidatus Omnitrophota bacterium]
MPLKKHLLDLVALAALAGAITSCSRSPGASAQSRAAGQTPAVPVTAVVVAQQNVPVVLPAIGNARAYASVSIKARVDGQLARVDFKQGDEVKKGDVIFQLDPRPFQAALDQANGVLARDTASLQNAETDMKRTDELADTKAVSATEVDANRAKVASLRATVASDKAAVESASLQLSFCTITSPVDGRVGLLLVDEGNMVKNNDTILAVVNQIRPIYVDFAVPEQSLLEVREATAGGHLRVEASIPRHPDRRATGELEVINNQVDASTGTLLLRAIFPNEDELLWPGQFVNVSLTLATETNAVVVPSDTIQLSQDGKYLFVVKADDTVDFRSVETGITYEQSTVIKKGLQPGERIVTSGQLRLVPGAKVKIADAAPGTNANRAEALAQ